MQGTVFLQSQMGAAGGHGLKLHLPMRIGVQSLATGPGLEDRIADHPRGHLPFFKVTLACQLDAIRAAGEERIAGQLGHG